MKAILALLCAVCLGDVPQGKAFPTFTRAFMLEPTADTSANVSIGDVSGDGRLDLVLIKGRHWPGMSRVLLGDGAGRFSAGSDLSDTRYRSYSGNLVDLNGDGSLDVILSNDAPDPKVILLNDGKGHFRKGGTFGRPEWETRNVAVADLNGDRLPDIVVANRSDKATLYVCLNRGAGRFDTDCAPFADYSATTITPADMNGDGLVDLVVPHRDGGQGYVYLNAGASFPKEKRIPFGAPEATVRAAGVSDLDGDGALDIVTIDDEHRRVEICYGNKAGGFNAPIPIGDGSAEPYALTISDLNRDGRPDIVVGFVGAPAAVYHTSETPRRYSAMRFGDGKGTIYGFAVADLDGDGQPDIAAARSEAPNMLYFGDGTK